MSIETIGMFQVRRARNKAHKKEATKCVANHRLWAHLTEAKVKMTSSTNASSPSLLRYLYTKNCQTKRIGATFMPKRFVFLPLDLDHHPHFLIFCFPTLPPPFHVCEIERQPSSHTKE